LAKALCVFRNFRTLGGVEVVDHTAIEGKKLVVAPISAPMLQMVGMPAQEGFDSSVVFDDAYYFENDVYQK
jgi:hypothetical protein